MNNKVQQALNIMDDIYESAKSEEQSLGIMNESMGKISGSSKEITGIIQIINDISDQINLLSLNASIEAARAGDSGRGFAVVADEISKLADQTASSIKNIDNLINTNDREIKNGIGNITTAVEKINYVIDNIDSIVGTISAISSNMDEQNKANETVKNNAGQVSRISEEIKMFMNDQKVAMNEISRTVGSINELSQNNTAKSINITDSSKSLSLMVENFNKEISDFED